MRLEVHLYNSIKGLFLKIPKFRNFYFKIESYLFDIFRFLDWKRYFYKNSYHQISLNEKIIMKFKNFYERSYFNADINNLIKFAEKITGSAWKGHQYFALWLVNELKPNIIVDLGVDKGYSTFIFAAQKIGKVYGIDWFMGRNIYLEPRLDYITCMRNKKKMEKKFGIQNITIIRGKFSEVVKKWRFPIDLLHIDGTHSYKDVKEDYQSWEQFLNDNSVVLFHDTNTFEGVKQFFNELKLPKYNFTHSYGLGVASKNEDLILKIKQMWGIH